MKNTESERDSLLKLLIGTEQGKMLLSMGFMYTVIVSLSLAVFYFSTGPLITIGIVSVYILMTSVLIYTRTPSPRLIPAAFLLFAVIPVVVAVLGILGGVLFL